MKITPWFTHPQGILAYVYMTFLFQTNTIEVILKTVLALSSFIMAVNGGQDFKAKVHLSIIKSTPHGVGGLIFAWKKKIIYN